MQKIIIDEEFKALLPALDKETYDMLEANLIQNGCRDSANQHSLKSEKCQNDVFH